MPLSDNHIIAALESGTWTAKRDGKPVSADELTVNPNSVNLSLGADILRVLPQKGAPHSMPYIDLHDPKSFSVVEMNCAGDGLTLVPGALYLASVRESFDCSAPLWIPQGRRTYWGGAPIESRVLEEVETYFVPCVEGRSTVARVGLSCHTSAGFGDFGFNAPFTLELTVTLPVRVHEGDELAQIFFLPLAGSPSERYAGAYEHQSGPQPAKLGRERFQR